MSQGTRPKAGSSGGRGRRSGAASAGKHCHTVGIGGTAVAAPCAGCRGAGVGPKSTGTDPRNPSAFVPGKLLTSLVPGP